MLLQLSADWLSFGSNGLLL